MLRGCSGLLGVAPRPVGVHPEDIGVIFVTPTEFSSNPKPYKEIIQTPTSLQLVWFPPQTTFRIYHHPKLNPKTPRGNFCPGEPSVVGCTPKGFVDLTSVGCTPIGNCTPKYHPDRLGSHPDRPRLHPDRLGCTPSSIWTPVGAVMKGVIMGLSLR